MLELTRKEWDCFYQYLKDLIEVLEIDKDEVICDKIHTYTRDEIVNLKEKIGTNIQILI